MFLVTGLANKLPKLPKLRNAIVGIAVLITKLMKSRLFISESSDSIIFSELEFFREIFFIIYNPFIFLRTKAKSKYKKMIILSRQYIFLQDIKSFMNT